MRSLRCPDFASERRGKRGKNGGKTRRDQRHAAAQAAGIDFETREYEVDESDLSGVHAAEVLGLPPEQVFKTLVLRGEKQGILVCVLPVELEVDLKKLAKAAGDKKVEMIHMKELLPLTGYIRGGCSPWA